MTVSVIHRAERSPTNAGNSLTGLECRSRVRWCSRLDNRSESSSASCPLWTRNGFTVSMFDQQAIADAQDAARVMQAWKEWLASFRWRLWATGTWERPVTASVAVRIVHTWLSSCPDAYAAVGVQRGPASLTHHVHLLIGGVNPLAETLLRGSWVKHGHVLVETYDPRRSAIPYLVEQADHIELIGCLQRFRPRRRRR